MFYYLWNLFCTRKKSKVCEFKKDIGNIIKGAFEVFSGLYVILFVVVNV